MSSPLLDDLRSSARDLVSQMGELAGVRGLKDALDDIEKAGRKHRVDATVTSAVPLTDAQRAEVARRLRAAHGDDLPIAYEVDPGILGGLVVRVGDRYIDGSVATRLGQLRQTLIGGAAG